VAVRDFVESVNGRDLRLISMYNLEGCCCFEATVGCEDQMISDSGSRIVFECLLCRDPIQSFVASYFISELLIDLIGRWQSLRLAYSLLDDHRTL